MPNNFNIVDVKKNDATAFVTVTGRIGGESARDFRYHCQALLKAGHVHLVIDMHGVDFIASKGAGALVALSEGFHAKGGTVQIMRASEPVRRVIELLNVDRFVTLVQDEEEAMANMPAHDS